MKGRYLAEHGLTYDRLRRWRSAVFDGDLARGLVPREGSGVSTSQNRRTALEKERASERAAHAAEVERLDARVRELEAANEALGKAIGGLLHTMSEQEPATPRKRTPRSGS